MSQHSGNVEPETWKPFHHQSLCIPGLTFAQSSLSSPDSLFLSNFTRVQQSSVLAGLSVAVAMEPVDAWAVLNRSGWVLHLSYYWWIMLETRQHSSVHQEAADPSAINAGKRSKRWSRCIKGRDESAASTRTRGVPMKTVIYLRVESFRVEIVRPLTR